MASWLAAYEEDTPGVEGADNSTVRLDLDNEPQPDLVLIIEPSKGGQVTISDDDYIEGPPELAIEIVASTASYDLHQKKGAYRRAGVREYLAWIVGEKRIVWWELHGGKYRALSEDAHGFLKSRVFPGLWLDAASLLRGDMKAVRVALGRGIASAEHARFVGRS